MSGLLLYAESKLMKFNQGHCCFDKAKRFCRTSRFPSMTKFRPADHTTNLISGWLFLWTPDEMLNIYCFALAAVQSQMRCPSDIGFLLVQGVASEGDQKAVRHFLTFSDDASRLLPRLHSANTRLGDPRVCLLMVTDF